MSSTLYRFWNQLRRRSPTAAVLWLPPATWSPSKPRNEGVARLRLLCSALFFCVWGIILHAADTEKISTPTRWKQNIFVVLSTGVNWYVTMKTSGVLHSHFAASLCHIWLFDQEKCNNTATYAQECLVWSCAQFFQFCSCLIPLSSFFLIVKNCY